MNKLSIYPSLKILVSSAWRGFHVVTENPSVTTSHGCSSNYVISGVRRAHWISGEWVVEDGVRWFMRKVLDEMIALKGSEPWRVYELDPSEVSRALDQGIHIDDVRGFDNRLEPWQPIVVDESGRRTGYCSPGEAITWERDDGWRVLRSGDQWVTDVTHCDAHDSVLEDSPNHFIGLSGRMTSAAEAMRLVDEERPWD